MAWCLCAGPVDVDAGDAKPSPPARTVTSARVQPAVKAAEAPTPAVRTIELGESVEGRKLELTIFGTEGPAIFIMAGIHGDEGNSTEVAHALIKLLRSDASLYAACRIGILPAANPDGLAKDTRANAHSVDLNRNFPARDWKVGGYEWMTNGDHAASEPETQAIVRAIELLKPVRTMSIHAICGGRECNNYDGPAESLAAMLSAHNGYPVVGDIGYPTPGSFESWVGDDQGIPSITLELPKAAAGNECWARNDDALRAFITSDGNAAPVASETPDDKGASAK